eukprot:EG_transcript_343
MGSDSTLCRLENYTKECAATDLTQPLFLDWGSLASPLTSDEYQQYPDLQLYPAVAIAVVPVYNLNGLTDLVLSLQTLAKIWSGRITTWDHPDIQNTNPNFTQWNIPANQPIVLVGRGRAAGATQVFKQAMAAVDPVFCTQVGTAATPTWGTAKVVFLNGPQLLTSYVLFHPYTLSYAPLGDALVYGTPVAKLNRSGVVVVASATSVQYALLELGLAFGNNGDPATHMTADIFNAVNPYAWPITTYSCVLVRKSSRRPGTTCATVSALVDFWVWFWRSDTVAALAADLGFGMLPEVVRNFVVGRFTEDIQCGGSKVWQEESVPVVSGYGPGSATRIFDKFRQAYALVNSSVALNYTALASDFAAFPPLLQSGGFVVSTAPITSPDVINLVLGAQAQIGISLYPLVLSGLVLAKVLNGDIQNWLHPDIVALNPKGLVDSATSRGLNDPTQRIVLLQGPTMGTGALAALLRRYYPAYTGAALQAAPRFDSPEELWSAVLATPYSFSFTALTGQLPDELQLTAIVSDAGAAVAPSVASAEACASNCQYDPNTSVVTLFIDNRSCYPLIVPLYVSARRQCPTPPTATARTVIFLQWVFTDVTLNAALNALNLVSLSKASTAIRASNAEAVFQLACGVRTSPTDLVPLLLAVIIPIAMVVLLGISLCGWWLWRVTENNRLLRKKFSNDNVAESCAEAIARFDLQAVAWLHEVKEPNKIQLAFLAIITLLTEVKPYIPDQLLSRLTTSKADAKTEPDHDAERRSSTSSLRQKPNPHDSYHRDTAQALASSFRTSASSQSSGRRNRRVRQSIPSSDGAKQLLAMKDWQRRRCTYMCVRFGSAHPHPERRLLALADVAGRIVDVAKAHGATIDAVGVDTVNVHWGVAASSGAAARAVQAGLEMVQLRDMLSEDQRDAFWLQMGIGKGVCDCGTVSSESGHRFFVVWGPEAALALHVAAASLPKRVAASLLVSPAVHQEVQYTVQCLPRLWHGDQLLWEPRAVLKKWEDDEWMYELRKMNEGAALISKALLEVFQFAKEKASAADLSASAAELRRSHGAAMSAQDHAAVDWLLATARPCPHHCQLLEELGP